MNDHSRMYQDSPKRLRMMDYCNWIEGFINYVLSNPRNISGDGIRYPYKGCKNKKKSWSIYYNNASSTKKKRFMGKYLCWFAYRKPYVPYETMVERMIESTSISSNVHEVVDDNNNPYINMVMGEMRMNQGYADECSIVYEEPNADATRFFYLLKDSDKPLWDGCTNHNKLWVVAQVFTIKSNHEQSEASYDRIVEWVKSILL